MVITNAIAIIINYTMGIEKSIGASNILYQANVICC